MNNVVVIGGGAAGMMAAVYAAKAGARVTLLERNEKLGKKIYITGKGRCNVTNAAEGDQFMQSIMRSPRFCYAALSLLDSRGVMDFLKVPACRSRSSGASACSRSPTTPATSRGRWSARCAQRALTSSCARA